jgi:hypothetical protein
MAKNVIDDVDDDLDSYKFTYSDGLNSYFEMND